MSDTGWKSPTSYSGDILWSNPTNAYTDDGNYAYGLHDNMYGGYVSVRIGGTNSELRVLNLPVGGDGDEDYDTSGGSSDLWHKETVTISEMGGLGVRVETPLPAGATYSGFDFDIPAGATIDGIEVRVKGVIGSMDLYCYHVAAKVYYTEGGTPIIGVKYPLPAFKRS